MRVWSNSIPNLKPVEISTFEIILRVSLLPSKDNPQNKLEGMQRETKEVSLAEQSEAV